MSQKKKRRRFIPIWMDDYIRKPYKFIDNESIKKIVEAYKKYGIVYSVMQYVNYETLRMAYHSISIEEDKERNLMLSIKERAKGIDGKDKTTYGKELNRNLNKLIIRLKKHKYKPKPVVRTYIPKDDGRTRPISIPTIEDSILQICIANQILMPITEELYTEESFGYRPHRGVKDAIRYIEDLCKSRNIKYAILLDNKAYFDSINREKLMDMIKEIIKDKVFSAIIKEILNGKYLDKEDNTVKSTDKGIYQGINLAPVLANLYLYNVIDCWYKEIKTEEEIFMVRYADDIIILCSNENDSEIAKREIEERFTRYDLTAEPTKTKTINLDKEDLVYLGYRLHKEDKRILKYIADKKITKIKEKINGIVKDSMEDWKEPDVSKNLYNRTQYAKYLRDYIREINNLLNGIYKTYKEVDNQLIFMEIYDYACDEVKKHWSAVIGSINVDYMINKIVIPIIEIK